ncbi:MAG: DUF6457 domain-containing protein [Nocardioidaceae bacterium]
MTLRDWINELCDALDIETELDEALVLDVARDVAHGVERPAAPITTYLLGYAAAVHGASPATVEELAGRASALAEKWDGRTTEVERVEDVDLGNGDDDGLVDAD